ncbi:MAG: hypothetical protein HY315_02505 [Acidobacteria bacterium]|nr:hypothetical protein [Acidobacteriota bacterium]
MGGKVTFQLTGSGWIEGTKRTGQFEGAIAKLSQLCQAAKNRVKGRQEDECCHIEELASDSKLPRSFLENVVESYLLEIQFPGKKMEIRWWDSGSLRQFVKIPKSFGMDRL